MQARGKGLPRSYEGALALYGKSRKKSVGRRMGNYRITVSEYDRGEDAAHPVMGIYYHSTEVATFYPDGRAEFTMGRWDTVSTHNVIQSVLSANFRVSLGSSGVRELGTCWYVDHKALRPEDRCWKDLYPIETRQRYMVEPGKLDTPLVRSWSAESGTEWVPLSAVISVPRARGLPRGRNTLLEPKLGDAFFDRERGNAYIWAAMGLHGCKGAAHFAVPYREEHHKPAPFVYIHANRPLHPVALMGNDFDPLVLSQKVDMWEPIDRTKGGVYAYQD